ncbi:hypothetical protein EPI10_025420 [Gossypium australe]|uniref:Uncharacterized protein n=1 Tax=Gossypium australe TaxID=47621 RepID=A0A5B6W1L6_9ROSI|nr:hypothetical protein EPI10_025420 [Gossypium australe]
MAPQEMTYELSLNQVFNSKKGNDAKTGRRKYGDVSVVSTDRTRCSLAVDDNASTSVRGL